MSWQSYVDDVLMYRLDGLYLSSAAILDHDGHVWAQSNAFPQFNEVDISSIMREFDEPGSLGEMGMYLGSTKFMVIQGVPGAVVRGKKGSGGITVKKTRMALIMGIYDEPMTAQQCNVIVERLGDFLIGHNL